MACIQSNVHTVISYMVPAAEENRTCSHIFLLERNDAHNEASLNLQAPRFLYIGKAFRYSPENAF